MKIPRYFVLIFSLWFSTVQVFGLDFSSVLAPRSIAKTSESPFTHLGEVSSVSLKDNCLSVHLGKGKKKVILRVNFTLSLTGKINIESILKENADRGQKDFSVTDSQLEFLRISVQNNIPKSQRYASTIKASIAVVTALTTVFILFSHQDFLRQNDEIDSHPGIQRPALPSIPDPLSREQLTSKYISTEEVARYTDAMKNRISFDIWAKTVLPNIKASVLYFGENHSSSLDDEVFARYIIPNLPTKILALEWLPPELQSDVDKFMISGEFNEPLNLFILKQSQASKSSPDLYYSVLKAARKKGLKIVCSSGSLSEYQEIVREYPKKEAIRIMREKQILKLNDLAREFFKNKIPITFFGGAAHGHRWPGQLLTDITLGQTVSVFLLNARLEKMIATAYLKDPYQYTEDILLSGAPRVIYFINRIGVAAETLNLGGTNFVFPSPDPLFADHVFHIGNRTLITDPLAILKGASNSPVNASA